MADFKRGRSEGGRGGNSYGGGRPSGGRSSSRGGFGPRGAGSDRPQMHKAICDECGTRCEVPFKPSGEKPVLCRECFGGGSENRGAPRGRDSYRDNSRSSSKESSGGMSKEQFDIINAKLDKILELVE